MALQYKNSLTRYRRYLQTTRSQPAMQASLWLILSLILVIGLLVMALKPTLITISGLMGQIDQRRQLAVQLDEKIRTVKKALSLLDEERPQFELMDEGLPTVSDWEILALALEGTAIQTGVNLTSVSFDPITLSGERYTSTAKKIRVIPEGMEDVGFSVTGTGEYTQIRNWLISLENQRRVVAIRRVKISKEETGELTVTVDGAVAYQSAEKPL